MPDTKTPTPLVRRGEEITRHALFARATLHEVRCRLCDRIVRRNVLAQASHLRTHDALEKRQVSTYVASTALYECADLPRVPPDLGQRIHHGTATDPEIEALPWKQALDVLAWLGREEG